MGTADGLGLIGDTPTPCPGALVWLSLQLSGTHMASCRATTLYRHKQHRIMLSLRMVEVSWMYQGQNQNQLK